MTKETNEKFKDINSVLYYVQKNIIAPKTQYNKFGEYYYRDAEDILEAAKKVLPDGASILMSDDVCFVPCETEHSEKEVVKKSAGRIYIKATVCLNFNGSKIETIGFAREEVSKKGMDSSQVTAAASSYARKIALNGLLMIEDSKDADKTDKTTKKEKDDAALMEKTGTDNIQDAKAANALGGSVRDGVDAETVQQMYDQALKDIQSAQSLDALKSLWSKIAKGKKVFTEIQWADLEQAKDEAKQELTKG